MSETAWWIVGWAAGAVVVLLAAGLLLAIIVLARRITRQAGDIVAALDGARANTEPLFDVANVNHALDRIARALQPQDGPRPQSASRPPGIGERIARTIKDLGP